MFLAFLQKHHFLRGAVLVWPGKIECFSPLRKRDKTWPRLPGCWCGCSNRRCHPKSSFPGFSCQYVCSVTSFLNGVSRLHFSKLSRMATQKSFPLMLHPQLALLKMLTLLASVMEKCIHQRPKVDFSRFPLLFSTQKHYAHLFAMWNSLVAEEENGSKAILAYLAMLVSSCNALVMHMLTSICFPWVSSLSPLST